LGIESGVFGSGLGFLAIGSDSSARTYNVPAFPTLKSEIMRFVVSETGGKK
jgi:hypothetical protein